MRSILLGGSGEVGGAVATRCVGLWSGTLRMSEQEMLAVEAELLGVSHPL
jgi:hypothetical protein